MVDILKHWRWLFLAALLVLAIIYRNEAISVLQTIFSAPIWLFSAALSLVVIEFVLQAWRFWLVFRRNWWEQLKVYAIGHFVAFSFPSRTLGEGARIAALARELNISGGDAAAYVSVERILDMIVIISAAALILANVHPFAAIFVVITIIGFFVFVESDSIYAKIMEKSLPKIVVDYIERSRKIVKNRTLFAKLFAITVVLWAIDFYRMWLILAVMGASIDYVTVASLVSVAYILAAISFLPGGLGAYEGGLAGGLMLNGVSPDVAVAATLYERFFSYWLWIAVGAAVGALRRDTGASSAA